MGPRNKTSHGITNKNETVGKHVRFIGMGGNWYNCPQCNRKFARGFFWEEGDKNGCSQTCLKKQI